MSKDICILARPNEFHLLVDETEVKDVSALNLRIDSKTCRIIVQIEVLDTVTVQIEK